MPYLFWIFLAYSFFGWLGETVIVSIEKKKFVNRGILNSPLSIWNCSSNTYIYIF